MIRITVLIILLLEGSPLHAQFDGNGCVDKQFSNKEYIEWMIKRYREIYNFQKHENIASVGAGSGVREVIYSMMADSLTIYVQDLNPVCLQPEDLSLTIRQLYQFMGRRCTAQFYPVRGKEQDTQLQLRFFDKIIVENSLHEFTFPNEMLTSIRRNLKPGGTLFIWEYIARKPGKKHSGCRMPLFTDESLRQLLEGNGFQFMETIVVNSRNRDELLYKFSLNQSLLPD